MKVNVGWIVIFVAFICGYSQQELDEATRKKLDGILLRLDDDDPKIREAAQSELEEFLDNDAMAKYVKESSDKAGPEVKWRCLSALHVYEDKKYGNIIYRGKDHNIWIMRSNGTGEKQLTSGGNNYTPSWSPDGRRILFVSQQSGNNKVYIMDYDGKNTKQLTEGEGHDLFPKFSKDGKSIVFERFTTVGSIFVTDSDGKNERKLSKDGDDDSLPVFSPDGKKIAFVSKRTGDWKLYIMDFDGKNQKRLLDEDGPERSPSFSADGKHILFAAKRQDTWGIYLVGSDGKGVKKLLEGDENYHTPVFSSDGAKIAFMTSPNADNWRGVEGFGLIYIMDADGKNMKKLVNGFYPSWGPSILPVRRVK
jgi:Tol biopolymer transport system component